MNIYQLQNELLAIFDEIEEAGGEITPELEQELNITVDNLKSKVQDYVNVIKCLNMDIASIKEEKKRLTDLANRKTNVVNRLSKTIIEAIKQFGDTKRSGVKYIDYGIGEVSIRKSQAVDADNDCIEHIGVCLRKAIEYARDNNQLDVNESIDLDNLIKVIDATTVDDGVVHHGFAVNEDDLAHTDITLSIKVPAASLTDGSNYYLLKAIAKRGNVFSLESSINKTELKNALKQDGACAPHIAKLVYNENLSIK